ncbi:hypothetical protein [Thermodesulforhabdus norvegica]|uniref:Uncharacterized protein n=1 Tax=Thermodesulforhabdus norvegica TaxID=39841 RepID=A0A1I4SHY3_9BACT|nr:hypothetical protein [Thermodesulforhabdus norvegica]SFM64075.1 hypothetical protein SAMN05660836_00975 [Thermodesulforhabdus norvegica]
MIKHGRQFTAGVVLTITFFVVLWIMFQPYFGGENAFHAADRLFNQISKGSSYFMKEMSEKASSARGKVVEVRLGIESELLKANIQRILSSNGITTWTEGNAVHLRGDLGVLLSAAVADSDDMYYNRGEAVRERYGIDERQVLFAWWKTLGMLNKELTPQKQFALAKLAKDIQSRAVEVGYNFYGIKPKKVAEKAGILTFALLFYVIYTMWWGCAILMLFDGIGLEMKAGAKKEV